MDSDGLRPIAIIGPTAAGKTRVAVEISHAFDGEIVSADSRQVYKDMDLGTGKDLEEYGNISYHLIDICAAGDKYNLYRFLADYKRAADDIRQRGKRIVVCGGSGMYVEAAINGMIMPEVPRNNELRKRLEGKNLEELTRILASMKTLHNVTDVDTVQRALRAIEIQEYYRNNPEERPEPQHQSNQSRFLIIGINVPRDIRRQRITERLKTRLENGMVDEVKRLLALGVNPDDLIYYGLEYKWLTLYVTGNISYQEMFSNLEIAIHQFAKRQMTWFRGMERRGHTIQWIPWDMDPRQLVEKVKQCLDC